MGYISKNSKKFKIFVANRIQFIRENADPKQLFYVPTKENPADDSSRRLKDVHSEKTKRWFEDAGYQRVNGPHKFLWMTMIQK